MRFRPRLYAWLLLAAAPCASAADGHHFFWELKGRHNTVYLLGSVHMLKAADSVLPAEVLAAYQRSQAVMLELDLSDGGAEALLAPNLESTLLPKEQSLEAVLGQALYASFAAHARPLGLAPEMTTRFQPWFAALLLEQMTLAKAGYDPAAGVDMQFTQRATADHKRIIALETAAEQLGIFAQLSLTQQRDYLRSTLAQLDTEDSQTTALVQAWQRGDTAQLETLLRHEAADAPELFRMLTTDRNRRWLPKITALLDDEHDDLVIVGAMHLVGRDGLIELLRRQGYGAVQH
jgi:uncharacterized protein YbaP (TraB family)